jgi:hypothetical protein
MSQPVDQQAGYQHLRYLQQSQPISPAVLVHQHQHQQAMPHQTQVATVADSTAHQAQTLINNQFL